MSDAPTSKGSPAGTPAHGANASGEARAGHRIEITLNRHRVRVIHQGVTMADTQAALTLAETGLPEVFYFPRDDVNMARLERSNHTSHCPFKGDASYFHLRTEDGLVENAVWCYEAPLEGAQRIKGYLAFYTSRVDRIDQTS
ncbi:DUF427 domain-containing protein [Paraburkholderia sp.]|jgi:uncharacterized protein (DUF427 family)|uniref:DUF427 domain-containing protein n=1 Tax=Paraburkholderia sp. TaxID=1926495 RepID=UPI002F4241AC